MVNQVVISGNLGQDPEVRFFEGGTKKCRFSVGVFKKVAEGKPPHTNWITVECWGDLAGFCQDSLKKGDAVIVTGSWEAETYEKDGIANKIVKLSAYEIGLKLRPKKENTDFPF